MKNKKLLEKFDVTSEELDALEHEASLGILRGEVRETITAGRPLLFGEKMRQVGFKEPEAKIAAIDARASQLGMGRSDYLRHLVDQDLALAEIA